MAADRLDNDNLVARTVQGTALPPQITECQGLKASDCKSDRASYSTQPSVKDPVFKSRASYSTQPSVKDPVFKSRVSLLEDQKREISTIAPVSPQYSPALTPPQPNIMYKLLASHARTEELTEEKAKIFEKNSKASLEKISRLDLKIEEELQKEMEAARSRDSWSTLATVAQYVASASAIALGISVAGTGLLVPGILLGMSGVAGGAVKLMNDTHFLQPAIEWMTTSKKLQEEIKQNIDTGAMYLQIGLGLAGGFTAWQAGAFAAVQATGAADVMTKASSILGTTGQVVGAGSKVGELYYQKHMSDVNAHAKELGVQIYEERQNVTHNTKDLSAALETKDTEVEQIRKAIQKQQLEIG